MQGYRPAGSCGLKLKGGGAPTSASPSTCVHTRKEHRLC